MKPPKRGSRPVARRKAGLGLLVLLGSACAPSLRDATSASPPAERPHVLVRVAQAPTQVSTVTLIPRQLDIRTAGREAADLRLYLGGLSTFRQPGTSGNQLVLALIAARDSAGPVLRRNRQILLDIDGSLFMTHPVPDPRLYTYEITPYGYTETVFVPITREMLEHLAASGSVRGRLGHWITFDISTDVLGDLGDLLRALPEDIAFGRSQRPRAPLQTVTF